MWSKLDNVAMLVSLVAVVFGFLKAPMRGSEIPSADMTGQWSIVGQREGHLRLQMQRDESGRNRDSISIHVALTRLQGLTQEQVFSNTSGVEFQLVREAGTFSFSGSFRKGRGAGQWTFNVNPAFVTHLRKHGYERLTNEELYALAIGDVGTVYIAELDRTGYQKLPISQLVSLYTNDVSIDYIAGLRSAGYTAIPANELVALRSNDVSMAYVKSLEAAGYKGLTVAQLIALRTNGVTRDFIERLEARGQKNLPVEHLLSLRTNGGTRY